MPRGWDKRQDETARDEGEATPNTDALTGAIKDMGKWTVDDVRQELGGLNRDATHRLAEKVLEARGMDITKLNVDSQMRSINRWINYEEGTGKQARKPNAEMQGILNRIGRNAQMARDGFSIAMSGDIGVNGYRRQDRSAVINMQGDAAAAWLENPTFDGLTGFYGGNSIEGFGDVQISIQ